MLIQRTVNLFNTSCWRAIIEEATNLLFRLDRSLLSLSEIPTHQIRSRHYSGIKPVSIDKICGSLARSPDFDHRFYPLSDRICDRWVGVAIARLENVSLPLVSLIQIHGYYFVEDGHHRISVARSLGKTAIDAKNRYSHNRLEIIKSHPLGCDFHVH